MDKFEAKSLITRKAMSAALKKLMVKKPLREITVSEVTDACGFHRQTFYYHFTTIKDLLRWTFETDVKEFIRKKSGKRPLAGGAETDICFSLQKQNLLPCSIPFAWKRDDYRFLRGKPEFRGFRSHPETGGRNSD